MEKIHDNMCFDVVFLYENIITCLFTYVFLYFLQLVLTFTPHYIIMVKGLLIVSLIGYQNHRYTIIYIMACMPQALDMHVLSFTIILLTLWPFDLLCTPLERCC